MERLGGEPGLTYPNQGVYRYRRSMTAQAHETSRPFDPGMKISSIREALPPTAQPAFVAAIEDSDWSTNLTAFRDELMMWRARAVLYAEGTADAAFAALRDGRSLSTVPWVPAS